jgi:hypothetical protein
MASREGLGSMELVVYVRYMQTTGIHPAIITGHELDITFTEHPSEPNPNQIILNPSQLNPTHPNYSQDCAR